MGHKATRHGGVGAGVRGGNGLYGKKGFGGNCKVGKRAMTGAEKLKHITYMQEIKNSKNIFRWKNTFKKSLNGQTCQIQWLRK